MKKARGPGRTESEKRYTNHVQIVGGVEPCDNVEDNAQRQGEQ